MANEKIENLITNGYEFDFGQYISDGFNIFFKQPAIFFGFLIVTGFIQGSTNILGVFSVVISLVIGAPLALGYALGADVIINGETPSFNDFFKGFNKIGPLLLMRLLTGLMVILVATPAIVYFVISMLAFVKSSGLASAHDQAFYYDYFKDKEHIISLFSFLLQHIAITFLLAIPSVLLSMSYVFAPFLVYFKNYQPWDAMETSRKLVWKKFIPFVLFFILLGIINLLGFICLFIGLLVTIPATAIAIFVAFDKIVGAREPKDQDDNISDHFIVG